MSGSRFSLVPRGRSPASSRFDTIIGASALQTPGGIQSEMAKINSEIEAFGTEVEHTAQGLGAAVVPHVDAVETAKHASSIWNLAGIGTHGDAWQKAKHDAAVATTPQAVLDQPLVRYYNDAWLPFVTGWRAWYHDHDGWLHNFFWNEAPDAEGSQHKLVELRATARKLGMKIMTPEPDIEGMSAFDPRKPGLGDLLDTVAKVGKYALYGGLVLGGAWGVSKVVEAARGK